MGEIADQIIDEILSRECAPRPRKGGFQSGAGKGMWRTIDGTIIAMADMTDTHLTNALNMCIRRNNPGKAQELRKEIKRRERTQP